MLAAASRVASLQQPRGGVLPANRTDLPGAARSVGNPRRGAPEDRYRDPRVAASGAPPRRTPPRPSRRSAARRARRGPRDRAAAAQPLRSRARALAGAPAEALTED